MTSVNPSVPPLISADSLVPMLGQPGLILLDASWYLPSAGRDPDAEYRAAHLPGAFRLDLDQVSDPGTSLPHMLPPPWQFARTLAALGISQQSRVVVYDGSSVHLSAPRIWWMLRAYGHPSVSVLDGGFQEWVRGDRPLESGDCWPASALPPQSLDPPRWVCARSEVARLVLAGAGSRVVDARAAERFRGQVDEPRPGLARGQIPDSRNLPFQTLSDPISGRFLPPTELLARFLAAGIDPAEPLVASCGSGVSACVVALALEIIRSAEIARVGPPVTIYDGSWAEWGASP